MQRALLRTPLVKQWLQWLEAHEVAWLSRLCRSFRSYVTYEYVADHVDMSSMLASTSFIVNDDWHQRWLRRILPLARSINLDLHLIVTDLYRELVVEWLQSECPRLEYLRIGGPYCGSLEISGFFPRLRVLWLTGISGDDVRLLNPLPRLQYVIDGGSEATGTTAAIVCSPSRNSMIYQLIPPAGNHHEIGCATPSQTADVVFGLLSGSSGAGGRRPLIRSVQPGSASDWAAILDLIRRTRIVDSDTIRLIRREWDEECWWLSDRWTTPMIQRVRPILLTLWLFFEHHYPVEVRRETVWYESWPRVLPKLPPVDTQINNDDTSSHRICVPPGDCVVTLKDGLRREPRIWTSSTNVPVSSDSAEGSWRAVECLQRTITAKTTVCLTLTECLCLWQHRQEKIVWPKGCSVLCNYRLEVPVPQSAEMFAMLGVEWVLLSEDLPLFPTVFQWYSTSLRALRFSNHRLRVAYLELPFLHPLTMQAVFHLVRGRCCDRLLRVLKAVNPPPLDSYCSFSLSDRQLLYLARCTARYRSYLPITFRNKYLNAPQSSVLRWTQPGSARADTNLASARRLRISTLCRDLSLPTTASNHSLLQLGSWGLSSLPLFRPFDSTHPHWIDLNISLLK